MAVHIKLEATFLCIWFLLIRIHEAEREHGSFAFAAEST